MWTLVPSTLREKSFPAIYTPHSLPEPGMTPKHSIRLALDDVPDHLPVMRGDLLSSSGTDADGDLRAMVGAQAPFRPPVYPMFLASMLELQAQSATFGSEELWERVTGESMDLLTRDLGRATAMNLRPDSLFLGDQMVMAAVTVLDLRALPTRVNWRKPYGLRLHAILVEVER